MFPARTLYRTDMRDPDSRLEQVVFYNSGLQGRYAVVYSDGRWVCTYRCYGKQSPLRYTVQDIDHDALETSRKKEFET